MSTNIDEEKTIPTKDDDNDEYEKICYVCRRPESITGKMISMPNNMHVCPDCLQHSFDAINNSNINYDDIMKMMSGANFNGMNMFGMNFDEPEVPKSQRLKKRKKDGKKEPIIDLIGCRLQSL